MIKITATDLDGQVHEIETAPGTTLMEVLREYEWGVPAICGGLCSCGTCHVYLDEPWLERFSELDPDEEDLLECFDERRENSRLSCQLFLETDHDGLKLTIAPEE